MIYRVTCPYHPCEWHKVAVFRRSAVLLLAQHKATCPNRRLHYQRFVRSPATGTPAVS